MSMISKTSSCAQHPNLLVPAAITWYQRKYSTLSLCRCRVFVEPSCHLWLAIVAVSYDSASYGYVYGSDRVRETKIRSLIRHDLQFLGCHDLLHITRVAIEHEDQGFVIEILDLCLQGVNIVHAVTVRNFIMWNWRPTWLIIPKRIHLCWKGSNVV
jgi:hypothetical protein